MCLRPFTIRNTPVFQRYMHGTPIKTCVFLRPEWGAPQIDSPEEVALVNCNGGGMDDGIWYSQHLKSSFWLIPQFDAGQAAVCHPAYNIETVIGKNDHLTSRATIKFEPLVAGERVLKFGLASHSSCARV